MAFLLFDLDGRLTDPARGITACIRHAMRQVGHRMWVVTSKPTVYAQRIVEPFGLRAYFEQVHGSELSGERSDKGELLQHVLRAEGLDPAATWMIGDRSHDVRGGLMNGLHTAGALWGYGSVRELTDAGADILLEDLIALGTHLGGLPNVPCD